MTDEKILYIKCLCHTGKKVYKYWIATLAVIGVIIGLGFVISSAWKQISDGYNYIAITIGTALGSIGYVLSTTFNNVWSLLCIVPWYWWVVFGVIAGPFILVAIYCAGKHYGVKGFDVFIFIVILTIVAFWGIINFAIHCSQRSGDAASLVGVICSIVWLLYGMGCVIGCLRDN